MRSQACRARSASSSRSSAPPERSARAASAASLRGVKVEIRAAEPGEEESLVALYEWLLAPPGSRPKQWDPRRAAVALRQAIDSHDAVVLVADANGELVGIC